MTYTPGLTRLGVPVTKLGFWERGVRHVLFLAVLIMGERCCHIAHETAIYRNNTVHQN
jgi:hypothetical protein